MDEDKNMLFVRAVSNHEKYEGEINDVVERWFRALLQN